MVHGIVTVLDASHFGMVEELWMEFERKFGVSRLSRRMPYPHISFHVAGEYDVDGVEAVLDTLAAECAPFKAKVAGLGIFTSAEPVLTLTVVRSHELDYLQRQVWSRVARLSAGILDYYHPDNWMPHISLAQGDLNDGKLPRLVGALMNRRLDWEITINNVTLMFDEGIKHDIRHRVDIGKVK